MIYGAAKAVANHLTRCVAMELGEHNVRVNSVSPRAIATGILGKALGMERGDADGAVETFKDIFAKAQPIPRAGIPDDIAHCVLWLASDRSTFVNGADIVIDGGMIGGRNYSQRQEGLKPVPETGQGSPGALNRNTPRRAQAAGDPHPLTGESARRVGKVGELRVARSSERFGRRRQRADAIARAILVEGLEKVALALAGHARHLLAPVGAVMTGGAQALLRQLCRPLKALGAADLRLRRVRRAACPWQANRALCR
jgi:hypothetical protein